MECPGYGGSDRRLGIRWNRGGRGQRPGGGTTQKGGVRPGGRPAADPGAGDGNGRAAGAGV